MESGYPVVFLPGGVLPAEPAYAALLRVLGERVDAVAKDLEVYAGERPPANYGLGTEVEGSCARPMRRASTGFTSSAIRAAARLRSRSRPSTASDCSVSRSSSRHGPATTGPWKRPPCGGDSRRSRRCRPTSSWRDSSGCNSRQVLGHHHLRKARRLHGWRSARRHSSLPRCVRRGRPRPRRTSGIRSARLLRSRGPQQPRLLTVRWRGD